LNISKVGFLTRKFIQGFAPITVVQPMKDQSKDEDKDDDEQNAEYPVPTWGWRPPWYGRWYDNVVKAIETCWISGHRARAPN